MSDILSLDLIFSVFDLIVVLVALILLLYVISRGFLPKNFLPDRGGATIVLGMVLAVLAHLSDLGFELLRNETLPQPDNWVATYLLSENSQWLMSRLGFLLIAFGLVLALFTRQRTEAEIHDTRRELEVSKYFEYQAEERFRYLFDSTSNSVYCYRFDPPMPTDLPVSEQVLCSHDAILQDCNAIFARELGADDPSEVVGTRMRTLDSTQDEAAHAKYFTTFIDHDYRLDGYDFTYTAPSGEQRSLSINMVGIVRGGLLHRMWAVESNTTELHAAEAALAHRQKFQALVAFVSSRLVTAPEPDADEIVENCMHAVCDFIGADRSTMFWINSEVGTAEIAYLWSPEGNPFGRMYLAEFPEFAGQLRQNQPVRIDDVAGLPKKFAKDRVFLENLGIKSLVVLPMTVGGEVLGGMTCGRLQQQQAWTDQEIDDLYVFAELFANFVLRLKSRRDLDDALEQLRQAKERLEAENVYLREEIELTHGFDEIIGRSDSILRSLQLVEQVAPTRTPVLIMGETGTGKELIARAIHELSDRSNRPLVKVNCAALPANLIESELFGHEKGAFTGADSAKRGRFDLAHGSTLFLDEIGEIPIELQSKLLRVLQEGEFDRLGGDKTIKVDVRLVVATNRNLAKAAQNGEFRSDLFYRINTFPIELPPLRMRGDDIQLLVEHFVKLHAPPLGREVTELSAEMMSQLRSYHWPGNVRELEGIVQRALISTSGPVLNLAEPLMGEGHDSEMYPGSSSTSDLKFIEREHIVAVLEDASWKISGESGAAAKLGVPPSTLRSKMKKLSIVRPN